MLVMDVPFERMLPYFGELTGAASWIFKLDKGTHWEFYLDFSDNIVLRARKDKLGGEEDAMFLASLPQRRVVPVQSVVWGRHVAITSVLQETREEPGETTPDIAPDQPGQEDGEEEIVKE